MSNRDLNLTVLDGMSAVALVALYNSGQVILGKPDDTIKKFRDAATARKRLEQQAKSIGDMHGYVAIAETMAGEEKVYTWIYEKPVPAGEKSESLGRTSTLPLDKPIRLLITTNPKRIKTRAWDTFQLYFTLQETKPGFTGEDYIAAIIEAGHDRKLGLSTLHWDSGHAYIGFGESEQPAEQTAAEASEVQEETAAES